jgi:hypothetical protein
MHKSPTVPLGFLSLHKVPGFQVKSIPGPGSGQPPEQCAAGAFL